MSALIAIALRLGVPQRFAKAAVIAALAVLAIAALAVLKSCYDASVVRQHEAERRAAAAQADREADRRSATQRRTDDARLAQEAEALRRTYEDATNDADRRLARHRCIRLQQAARASGRQPPAC